MPTRKGGCWYYTRTVEGKQYALHCRRAVRPSDDGTARGRRRRRRWTARRCCSTGTSWPATGSSSPSARSSVSPDGRLLAYSTDFAGDERFTLRVKDLVTGETAADEIPGTFYGARLVGRRLGAVLRDRGRRVAAVPGVAARRRDPGRRRRGGVRGDRRAVLGRRRADPQRALPGHRHLQQADQRGRGCWTPPTRAGSSRSWRRAARASSTRSSTRERGGTDRLLILHNDDAENFELALRRTLADPAAWTPLIAPPRRHPAARGGRVR